MVPLIEAERYSGVPSLEVVTWRDEEGPWVRLTGILKDAELRNRVIGFERDQVTLGEYEHLRSLAPGSRLEPADHVLRAARAVKDTHEQELARQSCALADGLMREVLAWMRPGAEETGISRRLLAEQLKLGMDPRDLNALVLSGPNSALPHGGGESRAMGSGDPVLVDFGVTAGGYWSDVTRTVVVGKPTGTQLELHAAVMEAREEALALVRPGVAAEEVHLAAIRALAGHGLDHRFPHRLGHGLGLSVHEGPNLVVSSPDVLEEGMILTIEPGVYLPGVGGVRIEDDVLVTPDGYELLTSCPRDLSPPEA